MFGLQTFIKIFPIKLYYLLGDKMDYVDRIVALRQDRDLKQADIAKVLNRSRSAYANLENKKYKFTVEDIILLCKYYDVTPEYILGFTDKQNSINK